MAGYSFSAQFLYLLVYTSSVICAASLFVFGRKLKGLAAGPLRMMAGAISAGCTLISVQVFLNTSGFLERLTGTAASRITIIFNLLISAVIGLLVYSAVAASFSLRTAALGNRIKNITAVIVSAMVLNLLILQVPALLMNSLNATDLLGISMIGGMALYICGMVFSTIRLFIPFYSGKKDNLLSGFRLMLSCLTLMPLLFILSGSLIGSILAPLFFAGMNILAMALVHLGLKAQTGPAAGEGTDGLMPSDNCRELGLSKRETEVALLLSEGKSYKEIAAELFISISTTQTHVSRIYSKLSINNKTELSKLLYYKK